MLYLLDKFDIDLFTFPSETDDYVFAFFWADDKFVKRKIEVNRLKAIFNKKEVLNLFNLDQKLQITPLKKKVKLQPYDMVIIRSKEGEKPFFILEMVSLDNFVDVYKTIKKPLDK